MSPASAGTFTVSEVVEAAVGAAAVVLPNFTVSFEGVAEKFVPVMVTVLLRAPASGDTAVTVGA